jgi:hypothetical protein
LGNGRSSPAPSNDFHGPTVGAVRTDEFLHLLRCLRSTANPAPGWLTDSCWGAAAALASLDAVKLLPQDMTMRTKPWRKWCDLETRENDKLPLDDVLTNVPFQHSELLPRSEKQMFYFRQLVHDFELWSKSSAFETTLLHWSGPVQSDYRSLLSKQDFIRRVWVVFQQEPILSTPPFLPRFLTFLKDLSFVCFTGNEAEFLFTLGSWSRIPEIVDVYLDLLSCVGRRIPDDIAARFQPGLLFLLRKNLSEFFPRIVAAPCEFPTFDPTILGLLNLPQADLVAVLDYLANDRVFGPDFLETVSLLALVMEHPFSNFSSADFVPRQG